MPVMHFQIEWPDGMQETCYSPSLVIKDYFEPGQTYDLADFVERSRTALTIASDRVRAKYGMPCGLAIGQLHSITKRASQYESLDAPKVNVIQFLE